MINIFLNLLISRIDEDLHTILKYLYEGHRDWPAESAPKINRLLETYGDDEEKTMKIFRFFTSFPKVICY